MPPPTYPQSSAIDDALIARLASDGELGTLLPQGVWFGTAPPNLTAYVRVQLVDSGDQWVFGGGRLFEWREYSVEAIAVVNTARPTGAPDVDLAAAQIDFLLHDHPLDATNYTPMACLRRYALRADLDDDADHQLQWRFRGGRYYVAMGCGGAH
jgi:hypothetical protein